MSENKEKPNSNGNPINNGSNDAKFFLASIVESLENSVISVDFNTNIITWNKGAERLYGYRAEEVIGKPLNMLDVPEDLKQVPANIEDIKQGEIVKVYETERIQKDGHHIHLSITVSPVKNDKGEIIGVSTIAKDISRRKRSENTLRENESRFNAALDIAKLGTFEWNVRTDAVVLDEQSCEIFGFAKGEGTRAKEIFDRIHPSEFERVFAEAQAAIRTMSRLETEYRINLPDGTIRTITSISEAVPGEDGKTEKMSGVFKDITPRKRSEESLRQAHERITDILQSITDCFFALDTEGRFIFLNSQTESYFGIPKERMLGQTLTEVFPKLKGHEILRRQEQAMTERKPVHFETVSPVTGKWVELHFYPTTDGIAAYFRDVTKRKTSEAALRESEDRFRALVSQATAGITQTDQSGRFIFVNDRYCEIVGYTRDELLNMRMQDISAPEIVPANVKLYQRMWQEGTPFVIEKQYIRKDGARVWVNNSVARVAGADGNTESVVCVTIDITERKQMEKALRISEERLRLAIDISQTSTFDIDLLTDEVQTDEIGREIYGWAADEPLTFAKVQARFHPEDKEYVQQSVAAAFEPEGRGEFEVEQRIIRTDGETRWIRVHGRAFFEGEGKERRAVRCLGTYIDITERKQVEQEREKLLLREQAARREAEEANRMKDEFLATVSHELRTPLNAILGWSQMLISGKFNEDYTSRALETIYRNAKSQAQLIEDILDVSRIITGKLRINANPVSLAPIIQSVVESLRPSIEAKQIRLRMGLDFEPRKIYADPERLQQVVWNLLSNAIKFTPEKGQITIELESGESETKVIVSDTGKGISPEFLHFVFDRFRQADGSTTRTHGGLGLGLAIVRHIIELHGGTVEVRSEGEGQGTTFTVRLPVSETPLDDAEKTNGHEKGAEQFDSDELILSAHQNEIKGKRILLVDDEKDTLELVGDVLAQNGVEVRTHTSVADALETLKQWKPDVIISDIAMPEEDGFSFIKKLKTLSPEEGGTIPAIALTAYVGIKERTQVLSSGFQMYVPKPVEPSELLAALASLV